MRILETTTSFPRYNGDNLGTFIYKKVKAINNDGYQNTIIAPHGKNTKRYEKIKNVEVYRFTYFINKKLHKLTYNYGIPENISRFILAKIQLPFLVFGFFLNCLRIGKKFDIFHANWSIAGIGTFFAAKLLNKKFILTMHGAEIFKLNKNIIISFLINNTNNIITNSSYTLKEIKSKYSLKQKNIKIIPFGVDELPERNKYKNNNFWRKKLNIPENSNVIFALGRFVERKGYKYLIKAFKKIEKKDPSAYLVMGGSGPLKSNIIKLIDELMINKITIIDFISNKELPFFYTNAFCFVLPSIIDNNGDTEGLGVVNIEALSYGTPVITTEVGGITDVIIDGFNGLTVEEKSPVDIVNAYFKLKKDKRLYQKLQINGIKIVKKKFLWESISENYIKFYKNCIS